MWLHKFAVLAAQRKVFQARVHLIRKCSDNITYSGGQASSGQGGYYGSGGSRAVKLVVPHHHPEACARPADISQLNSIMKQVEELEADLSVKRTTDIAGAIEVKDFLNKTMRDENISCLLSRLVFMGEPVWGLNMKERDFVRWAVTNYLMDTH